MKGLAAIAAVLFALLCAAPQPALAAGDKKDFEEALMNNGLTAIDSQSTPLGVRYFITQGTSGKCGALWFYGPLELIYQFGPTDPLGCNPVTVRAYYNVLVDNVVVVTTDNGSVIEFDRDTKHQTQINVPGATGVTIVPTPPPPASPATTTAAAGTLYILAQASFTPGVIYAATIAADGTLGTPQLVYTLPGDLFPAFTGANSITAGPDGALYGVASNGGDTGPACTKGMNGCGLIFRLQPPAGSTGWSFEALHVFKGGTDGSVPQSPLAFDAAGNVYGATQLGGDLTSASAAGCVGPEFHAVFGCGVVYKLTKTASYPWPEKVLLTFHDQGGGAEPEGPVTLDSLGNVYGTAVAGGVLTGACSGTALGGQTPGCGVVFELVAASNYRESVLYAFKGGADGAQPAGTLSLGAGGAVSGITWTGGDTTDCPVYSGARGWAAGCGTLYGLVPRK